MSDPDDSEQNDLGIVYFGDPEAEQPNWRDGDPDDEIDDDDDPSPISDRILIEMLGFDPSEIDDDEDEESTD